MSSTANDGVTASSVDGGSAFDHDATTEHQQYSYWETAVRSAAATASA